MTNTSSSFSSTVVIDGSDSESEVQIISEPGTNKRQRHNLSSFVVKTSKNEESKIDNKVALFFYSNNIAFNIAQSKSFKDMMKYLRPGYNPPDRHKLGGELLDEAANTVDQELSNNLKPENCSLTLLLDGWSSIKNDPIIATSIHTGKKSFLLNAIESEPVKKTAEYCAKIACDAIDLCEDQFNKSIFAVCTDNENKMKSMREMLKVKHEKLITYGCSAHYMNLVAKEIFPKELTKHIIEVQKFFRNHHQPHGWLKEKKGLMPQLPSEVRWNSFEECLTTFTNNYHLYIDISTQHEEDFPLNILNILGNVAVYQEANYLKNHLQIVSAALNKLQSDSTNISNAVEIWLALIENPNLTQYKEVFLRRFREAISPAHLVANMTDPKYMGNKLSTNLEEKAEAFLINYNPNFLVPFMAFRIKDNDLYPESMFLDTVTMELSANKWWQLMKMKAKKKLSSNEEFYDFLIKLHNCPASSAGIERIFSSYGLIWSKLRNRLGVEKATKLVKVHKYYRTLDI